jgi:(4S)-4-hydroxy-5-phosphonooxypentane-2,3-dione isomerase
MAPLAILVEFVIKPGAVDRFRELILRNADLSVKDEPGCRRFDVLAVPDDPRRFVLYEIYDDAGAFDLHLASAHYKTFAAASEDLVETRSVRRLGFLRPDGGFEGQGSRAGSAGRHEESAL